MAATNPVCAAVPKVEDIVPRDVLRDAEYGDSINDESSTQLVVLHQYTDTYQDRLLRYMSGTPDPEPCSLFVDGGFVSAPTTNVDGPHSQWHLTVTLRNLLFAPVLRIQAIWSHVILPHTKAPLHVALEFGFSDRSTINRGKVIGMQDLNIRRGLIDELEFTAKGATSEGFNNARIVEHRLGNYGRQLLARLRSLLGPTKHHVVLRFARQLQAYESAFADLLPFVVGEKLPSLSMPEYSALLPPKPDRTVEELVYHSSPFPMVSLDAGMVYSSINQAVVELYESSRYSFLEQELALKLWAQVEHLGVLYQLGSLAVMAVRFQPFPSLGGIKFDLPERLSTEITIGGFTKVVTRCATPLNLPAIANDAVFIVGKLTDDLRTCCVQPSEAARHHLQPVTFRPRTTRFGLKSQLDTAINLQHPGSSRWHQMILNQNHDLPSVDLLTARSQECKVPSIPADVEAAFGAMLNYRDWNEEQLEALRSIRDAPGGVALCSGPAGAGKSLVIQCITACLYKLGYHILVLCPANSNANDLAARFSSMPEVDSTRVFPRSKEDFSPTKIAERFQSSAITEEDVTDLLDFEVVRSDLLGKASDDKSPQIHSLTAKVLATARAEDRDEKYVLKERIGGRMVENVWDELRKYIQACDEQTFDWRNEDDIKAYEVSYQACKAHYVALSRLLITTTGNVRTSDIIDNYSRNHHALDCRGLVIVLDEAGKDREIDSLSALLLPEWRGVITGMIMFGDERQLEPTNTSAKGKVAFNPFGNRISIPLLRRLKAEGFPCVELVEQHRMSHHIANFPSKEFYPEGMRNGPGTFKLLSRAQPGLHDVLKFILRNISGIDVNNIGPPAAIDKYLRTHYLQIAGWRDNTKRSALVREHIKVFFEFCYWPLKEYYAEHLRENVMVIVAYKEARNCWQDAAAFLQQTYSIPDCQMISIMTIDSSQGCEAPVTFVDCSVQKFDARTPASRRRDIGFIDDDRRMNVAFTRAQEVRWILGGSCNVQHRRKGIKGLPSYVRYREQTMEVTRVRNERITAADDEWVKELKRQDVQLARTFRDDRTGSQ